MDQPRGGAPEAQVRAGMDVIDVDGQPVGEVQEVREDRMLVRRRLAADVYVPLDTVDDVTTASVRLNVTAGRVDDVASPGTPPT